jgi:Protein of unknown function (DUF4232)
VAFTTVRWVSLIALAALMGCAGGTSSKTGSRSPAPACLTSQLHGSFGALDAGAGQRYVPMVLTNVAANRCSVMGYPTLQLVTADGQGISTEMVRIDSGAVTLLTVSPGHRVSSVLHWIGIPLSDEAQAGPCEPTPSRADVTPPGGVTSLSVGWTFGPVCGHGQIDARPLRAGTSSG